MTVWSDGHSDMDASTGSANAGPVQVLGCRLLSIMRVTWLGSFSTHPVRRRARRPAGRSGTRTGVLDRGASWSLLSAGEVRSRTRAMRAAGHHNAAATMSAPGITRYQGETWRRRDTLGRRAGAATVAGSVRPRDFHADLGKEVFDFDGSVLRRTPAQEGSRRPPVPGL